MPVPPPPLLPPPPPPPKADRLPRAASRASAPSIARQLRRRAGIPRSTNSANAATPRLARVIPFRRKSGRTKLPLVAAVVVTGTVTVPIVKVELSVSVTELPEAAAQVGRSEAPVGDVVNAHVSVTVPAYPLLAVTVTVELAELPGLTAVGADALKAYVAGAGGAAAVTVTVAVPLTVE